MLGPPPNELETQSLLGVFRHRYSDVSSQDRGEAAGLAHSSGIPALRRPAR